MKPYNSQKLDDASDTIKTSWTKFSEKFAFCFRKLKEDDGIDEWRQFVGQCDIDVLLRVLDTIAEGWKSEWGNPKGPQIKRAYRDAIEKISPSQGIGYNCGKCGNSGALWLAFYGLKHGERIPQVDTVLIKLIDGGRSLIFHPSHKERIDKNRLRAASVPCVCGFGMSYGRRKDGDDIKPDCDYSQWSHKDQLDLWIWADSKSLAAN